uniref:Uncharacterized protein n=1 Tax=Helianthus annuus TaxID=4232 RepID=A0A251UME3_HELAN
MFKTSIRKYNIKISSSIFQPVSSTIVAGVLNPDRYQVTIVLFYGRVRLSLNRSPRHPPLHFHICHRHPPPPQPSRFSRRPTSPLFYSHTYRGDEAIVCRRWLSWVQSFP